MKKRKKRSNFVFLIIVIALILGCFLINKETNFILKFKDEILKIKQSTNISNIEKIKNPAKEVLNEENVKSQKSLDLKTPSGAVLVGSIKKDDEGWYFMSMVPLNITLTYYIDYPEEFKNVIKLRMLDDDNFNKSIYNNEIVTVYGEILNPRSMGILYLYSPLTIFDCIFLGKSDSSI